jgi:hypothetical protein
MTAARPRRLHAPASARPRQAPHVILLRVARPNPPPSSAWRFRHWTPYHPLLSSSSVPRNRKRASTALTIPFRVSTPPSAPLHSGELVEPVPGRRNPSSTPDFVQATPLTASTGESHPEPLHPQLAAPLLTLYSSSRHRARRSRKPFLGAPPPPRIVAVPSLLRHLHAAPPSR